MEDLTYVEILLVEDNDSDAELIIREFKKHNLASHLVWVKDGAEALDFINGTGKFANLELNAPPKLIILDLKLPKVSGTEVLKKLKSNVHTKKLPIVVFTSSAQDVDIQTCYEFGVNSYIVKPVRYDKFVKVIGDIGSYWMLINKNP